MEIATISLVGVLVIVGIIVGIGFILNFLFGHFRGPRA